MAIKSQFEKEDWEMLLFTPFWVMEIVSKADGVTDDGERKVFFKEIKRLSLDKTNALTQEIFTEISRNMESVSSDLSRDKRDPTYAIVDVRKILDGAPPELEVDTFCELLFQMGITIADSSGSITNATRRVDQAELRALSGLAILLEIDLEKLEEEDSKIVFQIHGYLKRIESTVL